MESIVNKESSYLDSLQTVINFESLRSDTERLAEVLNKDTDELEVVEDPFFATVLNPEGEFQFGDVVYKITRNYVYHVPEINADYLSSISLRDHEHAVLSKKTNHHPDVGIFEIQRSGMDLANKLNATARGVSCISEFVDDEKRLKGIARLTNWLVYMSASTESRSESKGRFRWTRTNARWIGLDADYSVTETLRALGGGTSTETIRGSISEKVYNISKVKRNLTWAISIGGIVSVSGWISTTHSGNRTDNRVNRTRSCSTYIFR